MDGEFGKIMKQNELLAKENRLLDSYIYRKGRKGDDDQERFMRERKKGRYQESIPTSLTDFQKYQIGHEELEYRGAQLKNLEHKAAEDISLLKAITKGIKIRTDELRRETYEFRRDICIGAQNQRTDKIMAERVIRYFSEKLKAKAALVEKMKLKNHQLKQHRMKMDAQVRHKEEQGDSLQSIDFHQLQIKNSQYTQKINELNTLLLNTKLTTGKTVQALNTAKRTLNDLLNESKALKKDIKEKERATVKLSAELTRVDTEVKKESKRNRKYKIQQSNPDMPQVLDYINQKSEMYELQAAVHNWERKIEIIRLAARRSKKSLSKLRDMGYTIDAVGNLSIGHPGHQHHPGFPVI